MNQSAHLGKLHKLGKLGKLQKTMESARPDNFNWSLILLEQCGDDKSFHPAMDHWQSGSHMLFATMLANMNPK